MLSEVKTLLAKASHLTDRHESGYLSLHLTLSEKSKTVLFPNVKLFLKVGIRYSLFPSIIYSCLSHAVQHVDIAGYFLSNIVFTERKGHTITPVWIARVLCVVSVCFPSHTLRLNPLLSLISRD